MKRAFESGLEGGLEQTRLLVRRQLIRRFGVLPPSAEALIGAANPEQLTAWADPLLDAATLEDVLR